MIRLNKIRKSVIWFFIAISVMGSGYIVRNYVFPTINDKIFRPRIKFNTKVYDFGSINKVDDISCYFTFCNTGYGELEIYRVITTCDCMLFDKPSDLVLFGQYDSILIVLDSNIVGYFSKEIIIISNSVTSPDYVYLRGTVITSNINNNQ